VSVAEELLAGAPVEVVGMAVDIFGRDTTG
jgi:hypothetical protein